MVIHALARRQVLKELKKGTLGVAQAIGLSSLVAGSRWRANRLLILGYHGISIDQEHKWNGELYMAPEQFHHRMELLARRGCTVLRLEEAIDRLAARDLPPKSVVITFDDGMFDFHNKALPILKSFGYPATVYLTTYYSGFDLPIFYLAFSYLLWKARNNGRRRFSIRGVAKPFALGDRHQRSELLSAVQQWVANDRPSVTEQNALLQRLATDLGEDPEEIGRKRILHLMTPEQVNDAAQQGITVELHTHRHRSPVNESLFNNEISTNRSKIADWTGRTANHFCYPNGIVKPQFGAWLRGIGVVSGVTCVPGLVARGHDLLTLPRLVDCSGLSELEFESWLSGTGALLRRFRG